VGAGRAKINNFTFYSSLIKRGGRVFQRVPAPNHKKHYVQTQLLTDLEQECADFRQGRRTRSAHVDRAMDCCSRGVTEIGRAPANPRECEVGGEGDSCPFSLQGRDIS